MKITATDLKDLEKFVNSKHHGCWGNTRDNEYGLTLERTESAVAVREGEKIVYKEEIGVDFISGLVDGTVYFEGNKMNLELYEGELDEGEIVGQLEIGWMVGEYWHISARIDIEMI